MSTKTTGEGFIFKDGSRPGVCKTCGEPSWSPRSNVCAEHRKTPAIKVNAKGQSEAVTANGKKIGRPRKGETPPRIGADGGPIEEGPVTQVVSAAAKIDGRTFSDKPPTAKEWENKLTDVVVLLSMTYIEYGVVRPFHLPDDEAAKWVEKLGMTDEEARTIVEPCAFLLAKTEVSKKHGREAIEVLAFAPAILAVIDWANRASEFRREMSKLQLDGGSTHVVSVEGARHAARPSGAESGPPIANFVGDTDPSQAPTARVDRGGADVDYENGLVS